MLSYKIIVDNSTKMTWRQIDLVFSSTVFLFLFLPLVLLIYYNPVFKGRGFRNIFLLLASLGFYAWGEPVFVFLMIFSIIVTWFIGIYITPHRSRKLLVCGIAYHVLVLFVFKYLSFTAAQLQALLGQNPVPISIELPIGISFFTFQLMSYLFDIYYGKAEPQRNPLRVGLYVALFPQLIAGPIVRYDYIAGQLAHRRESFLKFTVGLQRFVIGLGKKVLIADYMAVVADMCFQSGTEMSVLSAWLGAIAYTLQIYFDFSGYSDMAIGLGKMFGFDFAENFNYPYMARSVTDFWRRWHISLSSWFRDYVYIPLGGNRVSRQRWVLNFSLVWLLTGIWHGANWTFLAWGMIYLVALLAEKITGMDKKAGIFTRVYTLLVIIMAWVIFRADSLSGGVSYIGSMLGLWGNSLLDEVFIQQITGCFVILLIAITGSLALINDFFVKLSKTKYVWIRDVCLWLVFMFSIAKIVSGSYSPFIYFNF